MEKETKDIRSFSKVVTHGDGRFEFKLTIEDTERFNEILITCFKAPGYAWNNMVYYFTIDFFRGPLALKLSTNISREDLPETFGYDLYIGICKDINYLYDKYYEKDTGFKGYEKIQGHFLGMKVEEKDCW